VLFFFVFPHVITKKVDHQPSASGGESGNVWLKTHLTILRFFDVSQKPIFHLCFFVNKPLFFLTFVEFLTRVDPPVRRTIMRHVVGLGLWTRTWSGGSVGSVCRFSTSRGPCFREVSMGRHFYMFFSTFGVLCLHLTTVCTYFNISHVVGVYVMMYMYALIQERFLAHADQDRCQRNHPSPQFTSQEKYMKSRE
jgi:hypothetical protein